MMSSLRGRFGPSTSARAEGLVASPWSKAPLRVRRNEKRRVYIEHVRVNACS